MNSNAQNEDTWQGAKIGRAISIEPHEEMRGWWTIRGYYANRSVSASSRDMLDMAKLMVEHLEPVVLDSKVNWIRDHINRTGVTLPEAAEAWEPEHPVANPATGPDNILTITTRDVADHYGILMESTDEGPNMPRWENLPENLRENMVSACRDALDQDPAADLVDTINENMDWEAAVLGKSDSTDGG